MKKRGLRNCSKPEQRFYDGERKEKEQEKKEEKQESPKGKLVLQQP